MGTPASSDSRSPRALANHDSAQRLLAASGALILACAVALAAYAAHGVAGEALSRLQTASAFAFGHGLALAALAPLARTRLTLLALLALLVGALLFSCSIAAAVLINASSVLAPVGGTLLIAAWLLYAIAVLRGSR